MLLIGRFVFLGVISMPYLFLMIVVLLSACGGGGGGSAVPSSTETPVIAPTLPASTLNVRYGPELPQTGILKLPAGNGPHPLAVIIHGGCWNRFIASASLMQPMADALTRAGWATLNLEYRVSNDPGYQAPMTFTDIALAMDSLPQMVGNLPVNLKRTVLVGHSAGGHLALWAAARPSIPVTSGLYKANPILPQAVIGLAAIPDLVAYQASFGCGSYISNLRGNFSDAEVSPQAMQSKIPTYLFSAVFDNIVSANFADAYQKLQMSQGQIATVTTVSGDHFVLIQSYGIVFDEILKQMNAVPAAP
ncbi:alpha/beta hydrolase [Deefgea tanakiae]|uniref:Alpha/beta hydrolase n=1 Tax=Deefgea tanakiae TaxID=2865840 RepID=A0ABX8ZAX6_9NEIS|nr:alpha/beta hydrolase [Deefgea tanakiae]QZA78479.1 alpha/beta hydrolase [Deefgea tanakiae]